MLREDAMILSSGKRIARIVQEEAKYVLPSRHPDGGTADLAMEINTPEFTEYRDTLAAVLSGATTRSLAHLLLT
jgi:hypothetical protein